MHWSGLGRAGHACPPRSLRFLPAGLPHENSFPRGATCLNVALTTSAIDLAAADGEALPAPGAIVS